MDKNFIWIKKVIDSCENDFHFECVEKLIELYELGEKNEIKVAELRRHAKDKWNELHAIIN